MKPKIGDRKYRFKTKPDFNRVSLTINDHVDKALELVEWNGHEWRPV